MQVAISPEYSGCDMTGCYPVCRQTQTIVFTTTASLVSPSRKRPCTGINCIAPGCTNYYGKDNTVHDHLVSADRIQAQEWLNKLKIARPPTKAGVCQSCSNHFSDDQYESRVFFMLTESLFWKRALVKLASQFRMQLGCKWAVIWMQRCRRDAQWLERCRPMDARDAERLQQGCRDAAEMLEGCTQKLERCRDAGEMQGISASLTGQILQGCMDAGRLYAH